MEHDWVAYDPQDLRTHPEDGALIEARFENGSRGQAVYSSAYGGIFKGLAFNAIPARTQLKRWRYTFAGNY